MTPESMARPDLEPELRDCYEQTLAINRTVADLVRDLTEDQLLWKPSPSVWSISQCLDHLVETNRIEVPNLRRAIAGARSRGLFGHGPYRYGLLSSLVIKVMGPASRLKFKAPKSYRPADNKIPADVLREFFSLQQELVECIHQANGLDLKRTKVAVIDYKYLRLSLGQDLKLWVVHQQRHLLQAQRLRDAQIER
jgi:hypothetical protein